MRDTSEQFVPSSLVPAQEKLGQMEFVKSAELPRQGTDGKEEIWESVGFKLGEATCELFRKAELPEGWKKIGTSHNMWSDLVDEQGRVRAQSFYKAAFYDRKAHIRLVCRYMVSGNYDSGVVSVFDSGKIVHSVQAKSTEWNDMQDAGDACYVYLNQNFPKWEDPTQYWSDA